jgi:signal recognition particle GTPase
MRERERERERERSYGKMVLAELGGRISRALQQMSNATLIDEKVLAECLNEISRALLQADVQFKMVMNMQNNIKKIVNLDDLAAGHNKRKIIQQVRRESLMPPPLLATVLHWWDLNKNRKFPLYSS